MCGWILHDFLFFNPSTYFDCDKEINLLANHLAHEAQLDINESHPVSLAAIPSSQLDTKTRPSSRHLKE